MAGGRFRTRPLGKLYELDLKQYLNFKLILRYTRNKVHVKHYFKNSNNYFVAIKNSNRKN